MWVMMGLESKCRILCLCKYGRKLSRDNAEMGKFFVDSNSLSKLYIFRVCAILRRFVLYYMMILISWGSACLPYETSKLTMGWEWLMVMRP